MSLKGTKNRNSSPRAMPVETIITRYKSAQQKKQPDKKEGKEESKKVKKNKTDPSTKFEKSNNKSNKKSVTEENISKEYCPDKLKRSVLNKKVVLAPKHSFKIVGGTKGRNKRKLHIPQRDINFASKEERLHYSPVRNLNSADDDNNLSIIEMINMIENNGSLGEEDFLEILTCPSPVWWEDPPEGYTEDPISQKILSDTKSISSNNTTINNVDNNTEQTLVKNNLDNTNSTNDNSLEQITISISKRDHNFTQRRSKLESLLTNLKNKSNTSNDIKNNNTPKAVNKVVNANENVKREKKNSDSIDGDLLELRDDELLRDLENMDIPMEQSNKCEAPSETANEITMDNAISNSVDSKDQLYEEYLEMSVFDEESNVDSKDKTTDNYEMDCAVNNVQKDLKNAINAKDGNENFQSKSTRKSKTKRNFGTFNKKKSKIKKYELIDPLSTEDLPQATFDKDKTIANFEENHHLPTNKNEDIPSSHGEYITVYKIMTNDNEVHKESKIKEQHIEMELEKGEVEKKDSEKFNSKINCYYKQCKNVKNKKMNTKTDPLEDRKDCQDEVCDSCNPSDSKCILISDSDVKYCMQCSSIFDTDHCKYCVKRSKSQTFTCDKCSYNTDSKIKISQHLSNYCNDLHNTNHEHIVDTI